MEDSRILIFKDCQSRTSRTQKESLGLQTGELIDTVLTVIVVALQGAMVLLGEH